MYMKSLYHVQILMQLKLTISYKTISFISYYYQYPDFLIIKRTLFCSPFKKFHLNVFFVRKWVSFIHVHKYMYHTLSYSDFLKISILIIYMIDERVTQKCLRGNTFPWQRTLRAINTFVCIFFSFSFDTCLTI